MLRQSYQNVPIAIFESYVLLNLASLRSNSAARSRFRFLLQPRAALNRVSTIATLMPLRKRRVRAETRSRCVVVALIEPPDRRPPVYGLLHSNTALILDELQGSERMSDRHDTHLRHGVLRWRWSERDQGGRTNRPS